jgi:Spy/CpxP family protein refolding chaperone
VPTPPAAPRRTRLLGAALLVAAFSTGALAGAAGDRLLARDDDHDRRGVGFAGGHPRGARGHVFEKRIMLFEPLDLSEEQRDRIGEILERRREQMAESWRRIRPQLGALVDSTHAEIRALLTPEQQRAFDRLREDRLRLRHRWGRRGDSLFVPGLGIPGMGPPFHERRSGPGRPDDRRHDSLWPDSLRPDSGR